MILRFDRVNVYLNVGNNNSPDLLPIAIGVETILIVAPRIAGAWKVQEKVDCSKFGSQESKIMTDRVYNYSLQSMDHHRHVLTAASSW